MMNLFRKLFARPPKVFSTNCLVNPFGALDVYIQSVYKKCKYYLGIQTICRLCLCMSITAIVLLKCCQHYEMSQAIKQAIIINYVLKMKSMKIKSRHCKCTLYYLYAIVPASTTPSNTTQNTVVTMVVT